MAGEQQTKLNVEIPLHALQFLHNVFTSDSIQLTGKEFVFCSRAFSTLQKVLTPELVPQINTENVKSKELELAKKSDRK